MGHVNLTPVGELSLCDSNDDPVIREGRVVQGPWQWVVTNRLVAAARLKPGEKRVVKTHRGQLYRTESSQEYWEIFPTDPTESSKLCLEADFIENFAFVGNIDDLNLYRDKKPKRAMQFFPNRHVPSLYIHVDHFSSQQSPYELHAGDWIVCLGHGYSFWRKNWASRWIQPIENNQLERDRLIIEPSARQDWISIAQASFGQKVQSSQSNRVEIRRGNQDCTHEAMISTEVDHVIAPWLVTVKIQLSCLRKLAPEEYYRVLTPYSTFMESSRDRNSYIAWPPNNPRDIRILDQSGADAYHPVGNHGGFGTLWRKIVPTLAFEVNASQFPDGIRVTSKETIPNDIPIAQPGDYVVYDGNSGFYHWNKTWAEKNIEFLSIQ